MEIHLGSQGSATNSSMAIGFDERMLLHEEKIDTTYYRAFRPHHCIPQVETKSHPHPEGPDRLRAIAASLATAGIFPGRCYRIPSREITREGLIAVHSLEHIESVEVTSSVCSSYFTPDTYANEHSAHAARLAAGLCADLASEIVSGRAKNGFALVSWTSCWSKRCDGIWLGRMFIMEMGLRKYLIKTNRSCIYHCIDTGAVDKVHDCSQNFK